MSARPAALLGYTGDTRLTDDDTQAIATAALVSSSLSILGALSIVLCCLVARSACKRAVIFHLSLADFLAATGVAVGAALVKVGSNGDSTICMIVGAWNQSAFTTTFFLTLVYAIKLFMDTGRGSASSRSQAQRTGSCQQGKWLLPAIVGSWLVPAVIVAVLIATDHFAREPAANQPETVVNLNNTCCMRVFHRVSEKPSVHASGGFSVYSDAFFTIPLLSVMAANMLLYAATWWRHRSSLRDTGIYTDRERQASKRVLAKLLLFAVVFMLCWVTYLCLDVKFRLDGDDFDDSHKLFPVYVAQAVLSPLQGFFNCIVYGWRSRTMREALSTILFRGRRRASTLKTKSISDSEASVGTITSAASAPASLTGVVDHDTVKGAPGPGGGSDWGSPLGTSPRSVPSTMLSFQSSMRGGGGGGGGSDQAGPASLSSTSSFGTFGRGSLPGGAPVSSSWHFSTLGAASLQPAAPDADATRDVTAGEEAPLLGGPGHAANAGLGGCDSREASPTSSSLFAGAKSVPVRGGRYPTESKL